MHSYSKLKKTRIMTNTEIKNIKDLIGRIALTKAM